MSDKANIHLAGIQINFKSWSLFNLSTLSCDGVVLFQYLSFHCQNNPEWTHSDNSLERELGIKRTRLKTLRTYFESLSFLETSIVSGHDGNQIRAYRIDFNKLARLDTLKKIYRDQDDHGQPVDLNQYARIYKEVASAQPKNSASKAKEKKNPAYQAEARQLADRLKSEFDSRRRNFNADRRSPSKHAAGTITFSPKHIQKLASALKHFKGDDEYIRQAFVAFSDELNKLVVGVGSKHLPNQLRSPLNYFLSYSNKSVDSEGNYDISSVGNSYEVIYYFGDHFAANYSSTAR